MIRVKMVSRVPSYGMSSMAVVSPQIRIVTIVMVLAMISPITVIPVIIVFGIANSRTIVSTAMSIRSWAVAPVRVIVSPVIVIAISPVIIIVVAMMPQTDKGTDYMTEIY